jgi:tetratricopeptide (TPR) repeat protein
LHRGRCALSVALVLAGPAFSQGGEDAFGAAREEARVLMRVGRWAQARETLTAALTEHEGEAFVLRELTEVTDALARCAFGLARPAPKAEEVIAGRLTAYRPRNDYVSVVYEGAPARRGEGAVPLPTQDFELVDGIWFHPMTFTGPYEIGISVDAVNSADPPQVLFGVGERGALAFLIDSTGTPVVIEGSEREERVLHAMKQNVGLAEAYDLTIRVRSNRVEVRFGNERVAFNHAGAAGIFALSGLTRCKRVSIAGEGDLSWIMRRLDERFESERAEFEATYDADGDLPAWLRRELEQRRAATPEPPELFSGPGAERHAEPLEQARLLLAAGELEAGSSFARSLPAGVETDALKDWIGAVFQFELGDFAAALAGCEAACRLEPRFYPVHRMRADLALELGTRAKAIEAYTRLAEEFEELPDPLLRLAKRHLLDGRADEAGRVLQLAIERGFWDEDIEGMLRILMRLENGPRWQERQEYASRNYVVRSDISPGLCREAVSVLDTSRLMFERLLPRLSTRGAQRQVVYIFSGQAGYLRYAAEMTGRIPIHTAGLYSPVVKQLLIWSLPNRSEMLRTVRHEALHQYLDALGFDAPPWLHEGLAEYFELATLTRGQIEAGQMHPRHVPVLQAAAALPVPLGTFVREGEQPFYADATNHYAEAWVLVHYMQHGGKQAHGIWERLIDALAGGASAHAAVEQTLGSVDLEQLERELLAYVRNLSLDQR